MARSTGKRPEGRAAPLPAFVEPQLATLVDEPPGGDDWLHEIKFDGFRILCRVDKTKRAADVQLLTRNRKDWTQPFAPVARAAEGLKVETALLDGEVTILLPSGITSFQALQNHAGGFAPGGGRMVYFAFDLLHLDGRDLTNLPIEDRKATLARLLDAGTDGVIRYSDHVVGNGDDFFKTAAQTGVEGIVSKKRGAPYRSGRSPTWLKTKIVRRQEFVVGGFTEPEGSRAGLGALLIGYFRKDGTLAYAGKVGTGFTAKVAGDLRGRCDRIEQKQSPFDETIKGLGAGVHWVAPRLVAEVAFTEMSEDGRLRHPSFQGLREDKPASEVVWERPAPGAEAAAETTAKPRTRAAEKPNEVGGVQLSTPARVLYPDENITKRELALYYQAVAGRMLPQVIGRPLTLMRCPEGIAAKCFYMKHAAFSVGHGLRRVKIREKSETTEYLVTESEEGLIALVQMSVLEVHTWNSVDETLEQPDRVVFDLDPGPEVGWPEVARAAHLIRERLTQIGFRSFVKSTGGKGLHVVVPLVPGADWTQCHMFTQLVSEAIERGDPKRFSTNIRKQGREAKILIDYYRNTRGATSVAAYSSRARAGAPVSAPLDWSEVDDFSPAKPFTIRTLPDRLARLKTDPWRDYEKSRRNLLDVINKL